MCIMHICNYIVINMTSIHAVKDSKYQKGFRKLGNSDLSESISTECHMANAFWCVTDMYVCISQEPRKCYFHTLYLSNC